MLLILRCFYYLYVVINVLSCPSVVPSVLRYHLRAKRHLVCEIREVPERLTEGLPQSFGLIRSDPGKSEHFVWQVAKVKCYLTSRSFDTLTCGKWKSDEY